MQKVTHFTIQISKGYLKLITADTFVLRSITINLSYKRIQNHSKVRLFSYSIINVQTEILDTKIKNVYKSVSDAIN